MNKKNNNLKKKLEENSAMIIFAVGFLGFLSLCFTGFCVYKIYGHAFTTYLTCSKNNYMCFIKKKDILGVENIQYEFDERNLNLITLEKKKNILREDVYYLVLKNKEKNEEYLITAETPNKEDQQAYLNQVNEYLGFYRNTLELKNPRYKLKFIGLSAATAGSLIALLLFIECIGGIIKLKKKKDRANFDNLLNSGGSF